MPLTTCRRSCCWNPFGTCGKKRECSCHPKAERPRTINDLLEEAEALSAEH